MYMYILNFCRHKEPIVWPWVKTLFSLAVVMASSDVSPLTPFNLLPHYPEPTIWAWMFPKGSPLVTWYPTPRELGTPMPRPSPMTNNISKSPSSTTTTAFTSGTFVISKKWANPTPLYSIQLASGGWRPTPFWGMGRNPSYPRDLLSRVAPMTPFEFGTWATKWPITLFTSK